MFSKTFLALFALVGFAVAQQECDEAARFGTFTVTPNPIVLGQEVTVNASFACAIELGYAPVYTDYWLVVPASNNSGFQPPVYFARRDGPSSGIDTFTVTFDPTYYAFVEYPDAQYEIQLSSTRVTQSDSYGQTLTTGSIAEAVTVTQASD